ncbi:hypothetical protein [Glycomyces endophyticus]|uniref:hypothetical protein n=1 Tax=Glycomyces endophyticus TaxID=480996 RepID=UPI0031D9237A
MNALPPQDPSVSPPPPSEPTLPPHQTGPGPFQTGPLLLPPKPPSSAPSPLGLAVAGVGLAMLCVSVLVPRIEIKDPDGEFGFYSYSGLYGASSYGIDTPTVVLALALLAAVGVSALRVPAARWPSRIAAVGFAALGAAFTYHPVTVLRQYVEAYQGSDEDGAVVEDAAASVSVAADNGVYIAIVGVALLALSTFFMQVRRPPAYPAAPPPPPAPAGWPGAEPTVTVHPG